MEMGFAKLGYSPSLIPHRSYELKAVAQHLKADWAADVEVVVGGLTARGLLIEPKHCLESDPSIGLCCPKRRGDQRIDFNAISSRQGRLSKYL
ncbi:MAG: hypothetical protein WA047_20990 [Phenylobacterium sp.]|uniref:hypothetical protein n=1 Tax=Phenylobacterium sp. TaxID=1871053 RepID=UPI003BB48FF5